MKKHSGQFVSNDPRSGRKPLGAVSQRTKFLNALRADDGSEEGFIQKILEFAQEGNATCLQIAASRLWKEPRATLPCFELPPAETKEQCADDIVTAMVAGTISPDMATAAITVLRGASELTEIAEILARLEELEKR